MAIRRILAVLAGLLLCQVAHATRPEYWDFMWVLRVATVCWAQNAEYRDMPLAKALARAADESRNENGWSDFDRRPSTVCLKRLDRMPDQVCAAVTKLDKSFDRDQIRALRERHEVEAWRSEQALAYLEEAERRNDTPCPDTKMTSSPAESPPLDEQAAACVKVTPVQPQIDGRQFLTMNMAAVTKLAEKGDLLAQNELGRRYGLGAWVSKNSVTSAGWYRRAAEQGLDIAQANLAYMYLNGEGVARDLALALEWAKKSAAQGNVQGQLTLGYMYGMGTGVPKDERQAERCYLLAANQGSTPAQRSLAKMYSRGDGVPVDKDLSMLWFKRAIQGIRTGRPWKELGGDSR